MLRSLAFAPLRRTASDAATRPILRIEPGAHLAAALRKMTEHNVSSLLVSAAERKTELCTLGIVTERDVVNKLEFGAQLERVRVGDIMTPKHEMRIADGRWSLHQCLEAMQKGNFRHLPVREGSKIDGLLSMRDIGRLLVDEAAAAAASSSAAADADPAATVSAMVNSRTHRAHPQAAHVAVARQASVAEAVLQMREHASGSVVVPEAEGGKAQYGIFTERDYMRLLSASAGRRGGDGDVRGVEVAAAMTPAAALRTVEPEARALDALALMARAETRHVPVVTPTSLLAVLSPRDMLAQFV